MATGTPRSPYQLRHRSAHWKTHLNTEQSSAVPAPLIFTVIEDQSTTHHSQTGNN